MVPEPSSQEPDPDQSLPSGLSWSEVSDPPASAEQRDPGGQEGEAEQGRVTMFQRLSPRILLTLHSPPLSPAPAPASRASYYVPQQVRSIVHSL